MVLAIETALHQPVQVVVFEGEGKIFVGFVNEIRQALSSASHGRPW
jgi:hypothetical protein